MIDILIHAPTAEEYDNILEDVLKICEKIHKVEYRENYHW